MTKRRNASNVICIVYTYRKLRPRIRRESFRNVVYYELFPFCCVICALELVSIAYQRIRFEGMQSRVFGFETKFISLFRFPEELKLPFGIQLSRCF